MDPITHGIAGALIGKGLFAADGKRTNKEVQPATGDLKVAATRDARVAIWVCVVAAMFSDVDVFFEPFVRREMATIELHRGVTHSLACLPVFVAAMATLVWWWLKARQKAKGKRQKAAEFAEEAKQMSGSLSTGRAPQGADDNAGSPKEAPLGWWKLAGMWAAGIGSHIVLDATTSWGTMVWAPLSNARAAWDWVFIIDPVLTGIVLLPQVAAWVYREQEGALRRAAAMWAVFSACAVGVGAVASALDVPLAPWAMPAAIVALGALFFGPRLIDMIGKSRPDRPGGRSYKSRAPWCRAGLLALAGYCGLCAMAHQRALAEVREFAEAQGIRADALGALPMPPAATRWLGLIRTPQGSYRSYFNVVSGAPPQFEFIADDKVPEHIARAVDALPEVRTYRWFARFPVMRYREEGGRHVVEFEDLRFYPRTASQPAPFQYRVAVNAEGEVIEQGWVE